LIRRRLETSILTLLMTDERAAVTVEPGPQHVDFTILHLNDVYEATPVEGGRRGGLARVATLLQRLTADDPNTIAVMVGDFLAPSAIGATTHDAGLHMIEALDARGLSYATMGNHEFDVGETDLRQRIHESRFAWIVANVKDGQRRPFDGVAEHAVHVFTNHHGRTARVALLGICIALVEQPWLSYKIVASGVPAAAFAYPPFKGSGAAKLYDTRDMRDIVTDRLRRDRLRAAT